jgi:alkanesulfonate monooxygenase SsuD/methylene tetrahydromethanopterin reductase-like flavin-dependent oxidoreductase (luciferase family)
MRAVHDRRVIRMKINMLIPHTLEIPSLIQSWEYDVGFAEVKKAMQLADTLGFNKCTLGEHFLIPKDHLDLSGAFWHHGTVALGVIAGQTENIGLSSSINILPLQHAIVQAKAWSTLDWYSGGRATPVVAVGWLEPEFEMLNVPFHERGKMMDEYVQAMLALWYEEDPVFEGKYVSFRDVGYAPKPVNGKIPLWFGGDSEAPWKRVAKWGDGWQPAFSQPDKFPEVMDFIRSQPEYDGRPLGLYFPIEAMRVGEGHVETKAANTEGSWDAQQMIDLCGWLGGLGVTETNIPLPPLESFEAYLDRLRWVGEEIIPKLA